jgi:hypothetical protein
VSIYTHSLYWIHLPEHTDPKLEGYVGVSKSLKRRISEHITSSKKGYKSNPYLGRIIEKYSSLIQFTIIFCGTEDYCYSLEESFRPEKNIGWNLNKGGFRPPVMTGIARKKETKQKISDKLKGHIVSTETRQKISKKGKQRICSEETKKKLSDHFKGKKRSENVIAKISNSKKGKPGVSPSLETRKKVSEKLKNRQFSEETRAKISAAKKEYWQIKRSQVV